MNWKKLKNALPTLSTIKTYDIIEDNNLERPVQNDKACKSSTCSLLYLKQGL